MEDLELVTYRILAAPLSPHPPQHSIGPPKPRPFPPLQISRHRRFLCQNLLRPLPRLIAAALRFEKKRVVVISFRKSRDARGILEQRLCFLLLLGLRVAPCQQSLGAMKVIVVVELQRAL